MTALGHQRNRSIAIRAMRPYKANVAAMANTMLVRAAQARQVQ